MTTPTGYQITHDWPRPYFEAGASVDKDTGIFPVSVDGKEYLIDTASGMYRRFNVDVLRTRQNQTPNENLLVEPEVWRSMVDSWHFGAGQTRKDREDSQPYRYFSSKNIDPWSKWGVSLLRETALLGDFGPMCIVVSTRDALAVIDGTGTLTTFDETFTQTGTATLSGTPQDVATDGKTVYVLTDADLLDEVPLDTRTVTSTAVPAGANMVAYVKGFIVLGVDNALYDFSTKVADGTTLIYSAPLAGHRWVDATDGLAAGYLLGGQGDKWHAYWITVRDDAATLNPPVVAAPLPEGEIGYSLGSYLGFVLIGTDRGVRFCTPAGDNTLTYGRLVITDTPVVDFEGQDRFVWFGIGDRPRDFDEPLRQPEAGLARLDLSTFTSPLTPAYSSDLVAHDGVDVTGMGTYVVTWAGRRVFATALGPVFYETDLYAQEGWLTEGVFNQGVRDQKIALYGLVSCEPLPGGAIRTQLSDDSTDYPPPQITVQAPGSVTSGNVDLAGTRFDGMVVRHTLVPTDDRSETPRLTRFEFRSVPVVGKAHEWQVPLLIFGGINWGDATYSRDTSEDLQHLLTLVETGRLFTYREGNKEHRCFSPGYEWRPEKLTEDGQSWQGVLILRIRSIR
jgi:hypothetical protein